MAKIQTVDVIYNNLKIRLDKDFTIGTDSDNTLSIISDSEMGNFHAKIKFEESGVFLYEVFSSDKIWKLLDGTPTILRDGDVLKIEENYFYVEVTKRPIYK